MICDPLKGTFIIEQEWFCVSQIIESGKITNAFRNTYTHTHHRHSHTHTHYPHTLTFTLTHTHPHTHTSGFHVQGKTIEDEEKGIKNPTSVQVKAKPTLLLYIFYRIDYSALDFACWSA